MKGYFALVPGPTDGFVVEFRNGKHAVLFVSPEHGKRQGAVQWIEAVRVQAPRVDRFQRKLTKAGECYLVLVNESSEVLGCSVALIDSAEIRECESLMLRFAARAMVRDETNNFGTDS